MATTSRTLPGLGLTGGWSTGENDWGAGVNANWQLLSLMAQGAALDVLATLPSTPSQGDIYLLTSAASVNGNDIACYDNSEWVYFTPKTGYLFYVTSKSAYYKFDGSNWVVLATGGGSSGDYTLPQASSSTLGGVKVGTNLSISADGTLSASNSGGSGTDYTLPAATNASLGGVIVGDGLNVDADGKVTWSASMKGYLSPYVFAIPTDTDRTASHSLYNVKGTVLQVGLENYTVNGAGFIIDTVAGHTYKLAIATLNADHSINTIVATSEVTATNAATQTSVFLALSSPVVLSASTDYAFLLCDVSQSAGTSDLTMYGADISNTTMTYFGLNIASPWRAAVTDITAGLAMDASNAWGNGGYFVGVMGATASILNNSPVDTTAITSAVAAEATLREAADATKANLDGGNTMTGNQVITGSVKVMESSLQAVKTVADAWFNAYVTDDGYLEIDLNRLSTGGGIALIKMDGNGLVTTSGGTVAFTSQLPFLDTNLKWQVVTLKRTSSSPSTHTFPTAYKTGTVPFVLPVGSKEITGSSYGMPYLSLNSDGSLAVSNTGFTLDWETNASTTSNAETWLTYLVGGYT